MKENDLIYLYGADILQSAGMLREKDFVQHADLSCYEHSLNVARQSLRLGELLRIRFDRRSLVRGALLHDYFLYDWHLKDPAHYRHAWKHAGRALMNAERDFSLNEVERDIIEKHMFPMNLRPPRYRESILVCLVDKFCTAHEVLSHLFKAAGCGQRSST